MGSVGLRGCIMGFVECCVRVYGHLWVLFLCVVLSRWI